MDYLFFNVQLDYTIDESNLTKYFHEYRMSGRFRIRGHGMRYFLVCFDILFFEYRREKI